MKVQPVSRKGDPPAWIYDGGVPKCRDSVHTYGYYLNQNYKTYHSEMVMALGYHQRNKLPTHLCKAVAFVRVDTSTTDDESLYENAGKVESWCQISDQEVSQFLFGFE